MKRILESFVISSAYFSILCSSTHPSFWYPRPLSLQYAFYIHSAIFYLPPIFAEQQCGSSQSCKHFLLEPFFRSRAHLMFLYCEIIFERFSYMWAIFSHFFAFRAKRRCCLKYQKEYGVFHLDYADFSKMVIRKSFFPLIPTMGNCVFMSKVMTIIYVQWSSRGKVLFSNVVKMGNPISFQSNELSDKLAVNKII